MKKFPVRHVTGTWVELKLPSEFVGRSSHTITSVPPATVKIKSGNDRVFPVHADYSKDPVTSVFIVGGEDGPRTGIESVWKYSNGAFKECEVENPRSLLAHQALSLHGLLHIFGGRSGGTMGEGVEFDDLFVLREVSPNVVKFEVVPIEGARPSPRSYHASAASGDSIFVFGGCAGHDRLNDLWQYNSLEGKWTLLHDGKGNDCPGVRGGAGLFAPTESDVYVICGFNGAELADCWHFSTETKVWRKLEGGPGARSVFCIANFGGRAVVYGGEIDPSSLGHKGAGMFRDDVQLFDPRTETWQEVKCEGKAPPARGWTEITRLTNDTALLIGGLSADNVRLADAYKLRLHF